MRIHSDHLTYRTFLDAASWAHVDLIEFAEHGSRSRAKAFNFSLSGSSPYQRGFGAGGQAATWDEWGMFLAFLFQIDPDAHCGKNSYLNQEHFRWVTGNRFDNLTHALQHKRHKWGYGNPSATGVYSVAECECGAIHRWLLNGYVWEDISVLELA